MTRRNPSPDVARLRCRGVKRDGTPCRAPATSTGYCPMHDPAMAPEVHAAGGAASRLPRVVSEVEARRIIHLSDPRRVPETLEHIARLVATGRLDYRLANCIGFLAGIAVRAADTADLAMRIQALELAVERGAT